MPRSGPNGTYTLPGAQATQVAGTPIPSAVNNQGYSDIEQTFNTVQPVSYGGTGVADGKPLDNTFGVKNSTDPTKIGVFNASNLPSGTRTYDLPYYSGTLGLVSDIRGQIYGLTLSNNVTDATNDIDIAAGSAVDSTGVVSMLLASSLTKRIDAAWVVGTNQGGLDTGAVGNNWYYVFLIRRPDTGVVDVCFSASATAPTTGGSIPAAYTQYRRIGSIVRASATIRGFIQRGDYFLLKSAVKDYDTSVGTAHVNLAITIPPIPGIEGEVLIQSPNTNTGAIYVWSNLVDIPVMSSSYNGSQSDLVAGNSTRQWKRILSDNGEVRLISSVAAQALAIYTLGWTDPRGQ